MNHGHTVQSLVAFEADIAAEFNAKNIRGVIHLYDGNERNMLDVFSQVQPPDWVMCSWRNHFQCLLKGVPPERVKAEIMAGHSMGMCFPEYRIASSAIVGGILPIAVGVGMAIKMAGGKERVWVFLGEMTAETGIAWECFKYICSHALPVVFVVEDNGKSVCTETRAAWNTPKLLPELYLNEHILYYKYAPKYPHAGSGTRVEF